MYPVNVPKKFDNDILESITTNLVNHESFVQTVSQSLLKVIPNIILNKREEVIPMLVLAICSNTNSTVRDKLLQQIFNLKKKPTSHERATILAAVIKIANHFPQEIVESEILSQCWEQLSHKHVERRLLVAECCTALIPFISVCIFSTKIFLNLISNILLSLPYNIRFYFLYCNKCTKIKKK